MEDVEVERWTEIEVCARLLARVEPWRAMEGHGEGHMAT